MKEHDDGVPLASLLKTLRCELEDAMEAAADAHVRFQVDRVKLAVQVSVARSTGAGGGVRFLVFAGDGKHERSRAEVHTLELELTPVSIDANADANTSQGELLVSGRSESNER